MPDEVPVEKNDNLMCHQKVLNAFKEFSDATYKNVPEVLGLALVVSWRVGQEGFPTGVVTVKPEAAGSHEAAFAILQQILKFARQGTDRIYDQVSKLKEECAHLMEIIAHEQEKTPTQPAPV